MSVENRQYYWITFTIEGRIEEKETRSSYIRVYPPDWIERNATAWSGCVVTLVDWREATIEEVVKKPDEVMMGHMHKVDFSEYFTK